jgi:hypothetical protein
MASSMDAQLVVSKSFERDETTVVLKDIEPAALMVFLKAVSLVVELAS